jgi:hypothetical protein
LRTSRAQYTSRPFTSVGPRCTNATQPDIPLALDCCLDTAFGSGILVQSSIRQRARSECSWLSGSTPLETLSGLSNGRLALNRSWPISSHRICGSCKSDLDPIPKGTASVRLGSGRSMTVHRGAHLYSPWSWPLRITHAAFFARAIELWRMFRDPRFDINNGLG